MFVPQASHFRLDDLVAAISERKKIMPMWVGLANASITPAVALATTWLGAPKPFLKSPAVYGPCTLRRARQ